MKVEIKQYEPVRSLGLAADADCWFYLMRIVLLFKPLFSKSFSSPSLLVQFGENWQFLKVFMLKGKY